MHTVIVRYPTNSDKMTGWRRWHKKFRNGNKARAWAQGRDEQLDQERGNGWPRQILVDGVAVSLAYVGMW